MPDTFAVKLKQLREAAPMTVGELAEAAGLDRTYVWYLERGSKRPSWETVCRLADALGVSTEVFREGPTDKNTGP